MNIPKDVDIVDSAFALVKIGSTDVPEKLYLGSVDSLHRLIKATLKAINLDQKSVVKDFKTAQAFEKFANDIVFAECQEDLDDVNELLAEYGFKIVWYGLDADYVIKGELRVRF